MEKDIRNKKNKLLEYIDSHTSKYSDKKKKIDTKFTQWNSEYSKMSDILTKEFNKDNIFLQINKEELYEKSRILPQFMPHQQETKSENFEKLNPFDINYIENTNNFHKSNIFSNQYYEKTQNQSLKVQTLNDFISDKIKNKIDSNIHENTPLDLIKQETFKNTASVSENYEFDCQSIINIESNSINIDHNFSKKNTIENFNENKGKICNNIFKENCILSETAFIDEDHCSEKEISLDKKENNILLDLHTKFDHASTLFQAIDNDEPSFFKDISDTSIVPDKNVKDHKNIIEEDIISTQINYNDIWKTIGEDTDFLPDEVSYIENTNSYTNNIKNVSDIKTTMQNKEIISLLEDDKKDNFNQFSNTSFPFYLNNPNLDEISSEKPSIIPHSHQFHIYTNNTQPYSSNVSSQTNILNINKRKNTHQFLSSQIPTENYFSTSLEQNKTTLKSYISAKGGYLSPYDLPTQIIHKFRHSINPISNKYNEIQKHNHSLNHPETVINMSQTELYNPIGNISTNKDISNNPIIFHNKGISEDTINQRKLLKYAAINTFDSNANMYSVQAFETCEEKTKGKNKMFQDFPIQLSNKSKITTQNIHKTSHMIHIQNSNTRIQYPDMEILTNQQNLQKIDQTYTKDNQNTSNILENNFFLSNITPNINNIKTDLQKVNLNYFSLNNDKKTQDIYKKLHIQEDSAKSNETADQGSEIINKTDLYSQYFSVQCNSKKNMTNNEDIWDPNNEESLDHIQSYPFASKYQPYSPSIKQNLSPTLHFSSNTNNSYLQPKKQYDRSTISNEYSSFALLPHTTSDVYINSSLDTNENSKIYNFEEKSRTTYHKSNFKNTSHPILTWGFGGKIITIFPNKTNVSNSTEYMHFNSSNTFGTLRISNIRSYIEKSELLDMIPSGPLFSISKNTNKAHKKEAIKWMKEKIQLLEYIKNNKEQNFLDEKILLWKIIYILLENNTSNLQFPNEKKHEFTITADFVNRNPNISENPNIDGNPNINENTQEISSYIATQESLEQIKFYLLKGAKDNALQFCLNKKLWSHALLISSSMNKEAWNYVAKEFVHSEIHANNKNLQSLKFFYETLYESGSKTENSIFSNKIVNTIPNKIDESYQNHLNNWKEKLAIILSNPNDKDSSIIYSLAKKDIAFFISDMPNSDLILVGGNHIKNLSFYRNLDNIILNEILELCTALRSQSPFYGYPHLQAYKFYYTTVLTDFGYIFEAQKYCESINDIIKKYSKSSTFFHPLFIQQFQEFSSRFLTCESLDSSSSWFGKMSRPKLDSFWGSIENKLSKFVAGETNSIESQEIPNNDSKPFVRLAEKISLSRVHSQTNFKTLNTSMTSPFLIQDEKTHQQNQQEKPIRMHQNNYNIVPNLFTTNPQNHDKDHNIILKNKNYNNLAYHQSMQTFDETSNKDNYLYNDQYYKKNIMPENDSEIIQEKQDFTKESNELKQSNDNDSIFLDCIDSLTSQSYHTKSRSQNLFDTKFESHNSSESNHKSQNFNNLESESQSSKKDKENKSINSSWFSKWWGKKEQSKEKKVYEAKLGEDNSFVYDVKLKKWINKKDNLSTHQQDILPPPPKKVESSCSKELIDKESQHYEKTTNKLSSVSISQIDSTENQLSINSTHKPIILDGNTLDDLLEMASKHSLTIGNAQGKSFNRRTKAKNTKDNNFSIPLQSMKVNTTKQNQTSIDSESYSICSQFEITEDNNDEIPLIENKNIESFDVLTHTPFSINLTKSKEQNLTTELYRRIPIISNLNASKTSHNYPSNVISNAKYNIFTFIPVFLYQQHFLNLYFLLVALSQFIIPLRIGYLSTYIAPLIFVISITMGKELFDDLARRKRDNEANSESYTILDNNSLKKSRDLKVGDLIIIQKNKRIPSDILLLHTNNPNGECFIKTDQLDGETDWKLRIAAAATQPFSSSESLFSLNATVYAGPPIKSIHMFFGTLSVESSKNIHNYPLTVDNMLWANTVLASDGPITGLVIYTGTETRQAMNTSRAGTKTGLLESEINSLTKKDGKSVYAYQIEHDSELKGTIVRTSTIPEDLGRIEYLLTDKTGTLTQNDMKMKKLHIGTLGYTNEAMSEVAAYVRGAYRNNYSNTEYIDQKVKKEIGNKIRDIVFALSVTPTTDLSTNTVSYQSSSPDEIAIIEWISSMGLTLHQRDRHTIQLCHQHTDELIKMKILHIFPFTSKSKRMGIIVQIIKNSDKNGDIWFFQKGADVVMQKIVASSDWLDEECNNMAREGLRTLVIGRKKLTKESYDIFVKNYNQAALDLYNRDKAIAEVISESLECDLELLGLTGVEDRLQKDVKPSLELLRNAGIKIWMLTGDKAETAKCVAVNSKFVTRGQYIHTIIKEFISVATKLPSVIACRCTPTQKADIAKLIQNYTHRRVCCIGDGGNDVSMIQAANVGIGIVGKEGHQASLAADFSITQFYHLTKLLVWHGRNSYKRSAKLTRFVIHRGLLISVCQAYYSILSGFTPIVLFKGWLMVGYATLYTMAPVFSLVLDRDVNECLTFLYPELYKELTKGKTLNYKTFFIWVFVSLYQDKMKTIVTVIFTALILNELIMVIIEMCTWHKITIIAEILTLGVYIASIPFLNDYFDLNYIKTTDFIWKTIIIISVSLIPPWLIKTLRRKIKPPNYAKLQA
ncbi:hypothetical protein PMAC_002598 [Pneumocystis sp. 'macacae']|nr:hypothetical protein PMAC_002598 [Pneumocystis sp. 'macacae']